MRLQRKESGAVAEFVRCLIHISVVKEQDTVERRCPFWVFLGYFLTSSKASEVLAAA